MLDKPLVQQDRQISWSWHYAIAITGDGRGSVPAGLGVRLDAPVPKPATWAMMIGDFGLVGLTMRRRAALSSAA